MRLDRQIREDAMVIAMVGDLDSHSAPRVQEELRQLLPAAGRLLLDLGRLDYLSSAGLRVLLLVHREAEQAGLRLALVDLRPEVREVMSATGFLGFFTVVDTVDEALAALTA